MPTSKTRLQVILGDTASERVKVLAEEKGLSVSAMCSQLIHPALALPEFQPKPDLTVFKREMVAKAIQGADITDPKLSALLELVEKMTASE